MEHEQQELLERQQQLVLQLEGEHSDRMNALRRKHAEMEEEEQRKVRVDRRASLVGRYKDGAM
jgi:hypothetical protein